MKEGRRQDHWKRRIKTLGKIIYVGIEIPQKIIPGEMLERMIVNQEQKSLRSERGTEMKK